MSTVENQGIANRHRGGKSEKNLEKSAPAERWFTQEGVASKSLERNEQPKRAKEKNGQKRPLINLEGRLNRLPLRGGARNLGGKTDHDS